MHPTERIQLSGCAIINARKELLLLWKRKQQHYEFPGGKVEPGETFEETAVRECKEELGVDVKVTGSLGYADFTIDGTLYRSHVFAGVIAKGQVPSIQEQDKFDKLFWMPITQYKEYTCAPNVCIFCKEYIE